MTKNSNDTYVWITIDRLSALVDGIFAIVMTLLVLTIDIPDLTGTLSNAVFLASLYTLSHKLIAYGIAFFILAIFWRANHRYFNCIARVDDGFFWLIILWLMFVALVPFSTSFVGSYGEYSIPAQLFHLNFFVIWMLSYLYLDYAAKKKLIDPEVAPGTIKQFKGKILVPASISLLAVAIAFISPFESMLLYMLIPVVHGLRERK